MSAPLTIPELNAAAPTGYIFESLIEGGGQGAVFKGSYQTQVAAIKIINPLTTEEKRIEREVNFLKNNLHPTLVKVLAYDKIVVRGTDCQVIAYEYIEQGDLSKALGKSLPDQKEIIKIGKAISQAIDTIWTAEERVVHRDIKPKNIMKRSNGDYVLVDFGFARHIDLSDMTIVGSCGTPGFASPEQAVGRKSLTFKSDVFSLGVTLFLFATGKHPFGGRQPLQGATVTENINLLRTDLSSNLKNLIVSMLNISASERPGNVTSQLEQMEE